MGANNSAVDETSEQTLSPAEASPPLEDGMMHSLSSYSISIHPPNPPLSALLTDSAPPYSLADHLSEQVKDLQTYKELYQHEVKEMVRLRDTVSALQTSLETSMDSIGRLELDLSVHKSREETLLMENQAIRERIRSVQGGRRSGQEDRVKKLQKTHTLHLLVTTQHQLISSALRVWRLNLLEPTNPSNPADIDYNLMLKDQISKANAIIKGVLQRSLAWGPALSKRRIIMLCEGLFEAKYSKDREDQTYGSPPLPLERYIEDYLRVQMGSEQRAWQLLSRLVPGLFRLYQEGDSYGELISRLFSLFHPRPIPTEIASFLIKAKADFRKIEEKSDTGRATLWQAISSLYALFPHHPNQGKAALSALRPDTISQDQYLLSLLKQKMTIMGQTAKEVFKSIDTRSKGKIDSETFTQGLCDMLSLWIDPQDLSHLFPSSIITYKEFATLVATTLPEVDITADRYVVALAVAYDSLIDEQMDNLTSLFYDISSGQELSRLDTQKALARLDPSLTSTHIRSFTLSQSRPLTLSEFQLLVFKGKIGGFGVGPFVLKTAKKTKPPLREKNSFLTPEAKGRKGKEFDFDSISKSKISMSRSSSKGKLPA